MTIYHGDCAEVIESMGTHWGERLFDLLLTDPPYGIGFAAQPTKWQRRAGQAPESWDDQPADASLLAWVRSMAKFQIVWGGNYFDLPPQRCWLSWYKPDAPPSMGNVEYAWTNLDQNSRQISVSIGATNAERVGHPNQKPEAVMLWALQQAPESVRTVLDPFVGSGTTLVACKRVGLESVGIEREERYCEMAARRLQQESLFSRGMETSPTLDAVDPVAAATDERTDAREGLF